MSAKQVRKTRLGFEDLVFFSFGFERLGPRCLGV